MHNIPFVFSENIFIKINNNSNKINFIACFIKKIFLFNFLF